MRCRGQYTQPQRSSDDNASPGSTKALGSLGTTFQMVCKRWGLDENQVSETLAELLRLYL